MSEIPLLLAIACPVGPYLYNAEVTKVYDADTITADVDLGFNTWKHGEKLRLYGINAPEVRGPERPQGIVSRDWLRSQLADKEVLVQTIKHKGRYVGKYGRYLAVVWIRDGGKCVNLNEELVRLGYAEKKDY